MKVLVKLVTKLIPNIGKAVKKFWDSLDEVTMISKRELFLEIVATALAGIVLGIAETEKRRMKMKNKHMIRKRIKEN